MILFKKPLHELLGRSKCRCPFVLLNFELYDMVADEVVETPYVVCKTTVLTVELIGNRSQDLVFAGLPLLFRA